MGQALTAVRRARHDKAVHAQQRAELAQQLPPQPQPQPEELPRAEEDGEEYVDAIQPYPYRYPYPYP